jgi:3-hydroxybutyryl-CoA dehydrogenase
MRAEDIRLVAVVGTGAMGSGIALDFALHGLRVNLVGRSPESLGRAQRAIEAALETVVAEGLVPAGEAGAALGRINPTTDRDGAVGEAQYLVEAVPEDLGLKQRLFAELDRAAPPEAVLTSTTSGLSPTAIAAGMGRPERFVVTHYAQPAHLMMVVEVVPGVRTAPATVELACEVLRRTGHLPVVCRDVPGFIWSRLQMAILRECVALVRRGVARPEDIDTVMKFGYAHRLPAMGPFEHADLAGLDLIAAVAGNVWPDLDCAADPLAGPIGGLIGEGRLGMKSGRGFYDWTERDPEEFRRERDREVIRRLKLLRGDRVVPGRSREAGADL